MQEEKKNEKNNAFLTIIFFNFFYYSREIVFKTTKEVIATNGNVDSPKYRVKKNELVTHNDDDFFIIHYKIKLGKSRNYLWK
ncbi:MAG: hypothetical protein Q4B64_11855 [Spirochaetales bacterium]|nr:hypothetical protein [Spirochaetales bacterium]